MWEKAGVEAKREFVRLATATSGGRPNISELCRRFEVSRTAAYELLARYRVEGQGAFAPRSRRPKRSPNQTVEEVEKAVLEMRDQTHWGARKISHVLRRDRDASMPPPSTVNSILKRHGRITDEASAAARPFCHFEHPEPNDLYQMDFMGYIQTGQGPCHSLTVIDDHSRFCLCLQACANQEGDTVKQHLTAMFERYGLPYRMTMDQGSPWGDPGGTELTKLTVWIIRLGVRVSHSRPYHPQTQGKDERYHQTIQRELTNHTFFQTLAEVQRAYDRFRDRYNLVRPHESLGMAVPASRYRVSPRPMPSQLPPIDYPSTDAVRKVDQLGKISFQGHVVRVGKACIGLSVGVRPTTTDGLYEVFFCSRRIREIDLRMPTPARGNVSTMSSDTCQPCP